jgi:hypothetical protein
MFYWAAFEESVNKLLLVIDQIYSNGTKKFKISTKIRLAYAFFLMERRNDKKKALKQLKYAETLKPSFDQQFTIYRFKKIIKDLFSPKKTCLSIENFFQIFLFSNFRFQNPLLRSFFPFVSLVIFKKFFFCFHFSNSSIWGFVSV